MKLANIDTRVLVAVLAVLATIGCLVFVFLVFPAVQEIFDINISPDEYDVLAWNMAQGKGFRAAHGEESVIRGPGYPAFLALIYILTGGHNIAAVQVAQCFLFGLIVVLTFILARRLAGEKTALLASAFIAVHPLLIWYTPRILIEIPFTILLLLIFILADMLIEKPGLIKALLLGITIALAALFKLSVLIFPAVVFLLLLIRKAGFKKAVGWTVVVGLVAVLLISPWTLRNAVVTGEFIPVHASLALSLMCGERYAANAFVSPLSTTKSLGEAYDAMTEVAEQSGYGRIVHPTRSLQQEIDLDRAVSQHFTQRHLADPLRFIGMSAIRLLQFWFLSTNPLFSLLMLAVNGIAIVLALVGWAKLKALAEPRRWLPGIFILSYALFHAAIIGQVRYTAPILPLLLTLASTGFLAIIAALRNRAANTDKPLGKNQLQADKLFSG